MQRRYLFIKYSETNRRFLLNKTFKEENPEIVKIYIGHSLEWISHKNLVRSITQTLNKEFRRLNLTTATIVFKGKTILDYANAINRKLLTRLIVQQIQPVSPQDVQPRTPTMDSKDSFLKRQLVTLSPEDLKPRRKIGRIDDNQEAYLDLVTENNELPVTSSKS
jgi:hypothetical protein